MKNKMKKSVVKILTVIFCMVTVFTTTILPAFAAYNPDVYDSDSLEEYPYMEIVLDRKLSEKRIFPAIDIPKTSTRREDLLLNAEEQEAINILRKALNGVKSDEAVDKILDMFNRTRSNAEFVNTVKKMKFI